MTYITPIVTFILGFVFAVFVTFTCVRIAPFVIYSSPNKEKKGDTVRRRKIQPRWDPGAFVPPPSHGVMSGVGGPGPKYPPVEYDSPEDFLEPLDPVDPKKEARKGGD